MLKRFLPAMLLAVAVASVQAVAAVDVNTADESALRSINGIGPAKARAILDERALNGPFSDAADLAARVKGLGGQTLQRLQAEGLEIAPGSVVMPADTLRAASPRAPARAPAVAIKR